MHRIGTLAKRAWTVLREEGPATLLSRSRAYVSRLEISSGGVGVSYQTGARQDFEDRWQLLREQIEEDHDTLLDIGCAEGQLTGRLAEMGLFTIGIDRHAHTVANARSKHRDQPNLAFAEYDLDPENAHAIPSVDVVLLLTVHHHWVREFGHEDAEAMLQTVCDNCDRLLFEMPDRRVKRPPLSDDEFDSVEAYYEAYFETVLEGSPTVEFLGRTDYKGEERSDVLFSIDTP